MLNWVYFKIPENLQRKIMRSDARMEVVRTCAQNILMNVQITVSLSLKEKNFSLILADFWRAKYKRISKDSSNKKATLVENIKFREESCTICKGEHFLFDGQKQYPCPACTRKSKKDILELGARKVKIYG